MEEKLYLSENVPYTKTESVLLKKTTIVINNLDRFNGKSLTGIAKGITGQDVTPYRIKIGLISSLINVSVDDRYSEYLERYIHPSHDFGTVIGIGVWREF
jgi:hypothetical protein